MEGQETCIPMARAVDIRGCHSQTVMAVENIRPGQPVREQETTRQRTAMVLRLGC